MKKRAVFFFSAAFVLASGLFPGQSEVPKAQLPVLTTSAGQSNDVNALNIVLEEAEILYDYCDVPTLEMLQGGVGLGDKESAAGFHVEVTTDLQKFPKGTPYKTAIFAIGASLKGMGASGLTVDSEEARVKKLVDYCKKNKIFVFAVHLGGEATRGPAGSDNERMIDAVAPFADGLVVVKDSNKDGRFTKIAEKAKIPLTQIDYTLGLV
ncbi:MAG: hypothetical protein FJY82_03165, partial [Candidatus Aminicenantes bacterium]|nr:hypothetical protein [Candidatus Aminicenantes bacterium]